MAVKIITARSPRDSSYRPAPETETTPALTPFTPMSDKRSRSVGMSFSVATETIFGLDDTGHATNRKGMQVESRKQGDEISLKEGTDLLWPRKVNPPTVQYRVPDAVVLPSSILLCPLYVRPHVVRW